MRPKKKASIRLYNRSIDEYPGVDEKSYDELVE